MKKVLSIGAHPDDIEIGCGGTEIKLKNKGYEIYHVICTNGEEGSLDKNKEGLKKIRKNEAMISAKTIGVKKTIFLNLEDGLTNYTKSDRVKLIHIIRKIKPNIVFTHSFSDALSDHKIIHDLVMSSIKGAAGPWYPGFALKPHFVSQVFGFEVWSPINNPSYYSNITDVLKEKMQSIKAHKSQLKNVNYASAIKGLAQYRGMTSMLGKYVEAFEVYSTGELI